MTNVFDLLDERGYLQQCTNEEEVKKQLAEGPVTFYIGFDATADSLTAGHFLTVMAMMHMQKAGHRPIALLGGGTTMIGDPSMRNDMRQMMTREQIDHNAECFKKQLSKYINFDNDNAILANNADWLLDLNYVDFLREVGIYFSVNRMLAAECYKSRMEQGLTFFEFNYMLMQSYDFYVLNQKYNATLEMGGDDQWSNIIGGVELVRKKVQKPVNGLTFKLLTTSDGKKMGKTMAGALWLDPDKTSPYDFYQYWRNIEDVKVRECMGVLTFLPMEEINELTEHQDERMNKAKEVFAYEVTKIVHGEEDAKRAQTAAMSVFVTGGDAGSIPTKTYDKKTLSDGIDILTLLTDSGLAKSRSEARRLITQGGVTVNDEKVSDIEAVFGSENFNENDALMIRKGKKSVIQIKAE